MSRIGDAFASFTAKIQAANDRIDQMGRAIERRLVRDWRRVVRKSASFWGNVLLALVSAIAGGFSSDGTFMWSMAIANIAVAVLRIVMQKGFDDAN